ncbi:hypothetical protein Q7C36_016472 [Tachysurus vachellii]|uniref:Uncharacterized protein n=1 Tax=Tachysurus vachellii TaxID=175792 RepID=A0AA88SA83_TACVA|nr:hypothetical protein Q7C36_016472 [Tachysurus vachellii]
MRVEAKFKKMHKKLDGGFRMSSASRLPGCRGHEFGGDTVGCSDSLTGGCSQTVCAVFIGAGLSGEEHRVSSIHLCEPESVFDQ